MVLKYLFYTETINIMDVIIIGAGLAGLSAGIHLLNRGFKVRIYEKRSCAGGRASRFEERGFRIDMGPTLVFIPDVIEDLFASVGRNRCDYFRLKRLEPGYRVGFSDGKSFIMCSDISELKRQIAEFAPGRERLFDRYCRDVGDKFEFSRGAFIEKNFNSILEMADGDSISSLFKIKPWGTAYGHVNRYFRNPHLAGAFSFQTFYLGQSPCRTPSLYNLLAYLEFTYGTWYPMGGLYEVPLALARLFEEMGGVLRINAEVEKIHVENGRAAGVRLKPDELELADVVVSNRDLPASMRDFVDQRHRPRVSDRKIRGWHYGASCFMMYLGLRRKIEGLFHHNILINTDFKGATRRIFDKGLLPEEPYLYVCCPSKTDPLAAPEGKEALYILAIVPNLKGRVHWGREAKAFRKKILERLAANGTPVREEDIEVEKVMTPHDFEKEFGTYDGAAFGLSPDFFQSAAFRPPIRSKDVRGLYHVGASTHPGGGIPVTLTCGKLAAEQIVKDFGVPVRR